MSKFLANDLVVYIVKKIASQFNAKL